MQHRFWRIFFWVVAALVTVGSSYALAATLPPGFSDVTVAGGLNQPIAMEFAPDGRIFVTEKQGSVRIIKDGALLPTPFLNLPVTSNLERGLLGITLDPQFATSNLVYAYYSTASTTVKNRVSRFTASSTEPDVVMSGSEVVLLDGIPSDSGIHNGGALHFGTDGMLYVTTGDAGRTANAQNLASLGGKILRITGDGGIPDDNPFISSSSTLPHIWAYGLRNPFTFAVSQSTGAIFINDVGEGSWEEINLGAAGVNYGWPLCEGACTRAGMTNPIYQYHHGVGSSITGATFYESDAFPEEYRGLYFYGDYVANFIKAFNASTSQSIDFAGNIPAPVDIRTGPDGALYYLSITEGSLHKIVFNAATSTPPTPTSTSPTAYSAEYFNNVDLSGQPAFTRGDEAIDFDWGGGSPNPVIRSDNFSARWTKSVEFAEGTYEFTAIADDGIRIYLDGVRILDKWIDQPPTTYRIRTGISEGSHTIAIEYYERGGGAVAKVSYRPAPLNQLPAGAITAPSEGMLYRAGDTISYSGTGSDPEDGTLPDSAFTWNIIFHHDTHTHPFLGPITGRRSGNFQIPRQGEVSANVWYEIQLTLTDSVGGTRILSREVHPRVSELTLESVPSGLEVFLDGQPHQTPYQVLSVVGFERTLEAPASQASGTVPYNFSSWSDNGARSHVITVPDSDRTYTAHYTEQGSTIPTSTVVTIFAAGTSASGVYPTMQLLADNVVVQTWQDVRGNPDSRNFLEFTSTLSSRPNTLKIAFVNDHYGGPGQDRNLVVDRIAVDGVILETEDPAVQSTGTWRSQDDCSLGNKQSEILHCNGYFSFILPSTTPPPEIPPNPPPAATSTTSTIVIHAAGTPALGEYPTLQLFLNDQLAHTFASVRGDAAGRIFEQLQYSRSTPILASQVKLQFSNDHYSGNEDRNLLIDKIVIDGVAHETEDPRTLSTGTWRSEDGCSPGNKRSEMLHCGGYFLYNQ